MVSISYEYAPDYVINVSGVNTFEEPGFITAGCDLPGWSLIVYVLVLVTAVFKTVKSAPNI